MGVAKFTYFGQTKFDITDSNCTANNMLNGTVAYNNAGNKVTGNVVIQKYYTGSSAPTSSLGNNGDLYLKA